MTPKIGLALSGGGVRGFAHLGVLKVLKKYEISVDAVAGTSAGALAAALFAVGTDLEMVEKIFLEVNLKKLLNVRFHRTGLVDGGNLIELVRMFTKNKNIEDAAIPLRIVAVDLVKRETVVFERGNIADCVRASIAIPGIFTPVKKDGMLLVDGFVLNNCPDDIVKSMNTDIVIAVNLDIKTYDEPANIFEVVLRSLEIMSGKKSPCADVVISPLTQPVGQLDFSKAKDCLLMGETAAEAKIFEIKKVIEQFSR